jgi:hypothetical protein
MRYSRVWLLTPGSYLWLTEELCGWYFLLLINNEIKPMKGRCYATPV